VSFFQLIGSREDDISAAIAWSLAKSTEFLGQFLKLVLGATPHWENANIQLHRYEEEGGITDIEIFETGKFHLIVEAKRGWILPGLDQLKKYAARQSFAADRSARRILVTMSECSTEYASAHLPAKHIGSVPVAHVSWKNIFSCAQGAFPAAGHAEKRLLSEMTDYLRTIMTTQRQHSNWVFVVSLGSNTPDGWRTSWIDIVRKYSRYFHPIAPHWPKEPPTYVGFRYGGKLQSVHFIERYEVIDNLSKACPGIADDMVEPHFLYFLGPPIVPLHEVKNGNVYPSGRVWCALDTLLTSSSVSEARDITQQRMSEV